jgi:predicted phosphodiesterase
VSNGVIVYGDPHGDWKPLLRACEEERPGAVVILGDCDLALPLRQQIRQIFNSGIRVRWIPGNHDSDTPEWHDRLWGDFPEGNLHARWGQVGSLTFAGLGGVFKERIWYPQFAATQPKFASRRDYLRQLPRNERWRGALPLRARDAIFPEDIEALRGLRADVLVTHEAPTCHRHGFVGINIAAEMCRARLVVHGHHHEDYAGIVPGTEVRVRGLGRAQILRLRPGDLT